MKAKTLALLSAAGMLLTSVSVYSLTPAGGVHWDKGNEAIATDIPEKVDEPTKPQSELGRFLSGSTVTVDGRVGNAKMVKNARGETFLMLELKGSDAENGKVAAPVNLSLVIDRSGSMRGTRLANAMNAAIAAVDRLHDGDVVSVLSFDTRTQVVVPPQTIAPGVRERIAADIRGISLGGDTCISCGIEDGMAQIERTVGKVNRMIVLSDGEATAGVRDVPTFRSIAQRARDRGVAITTIGVDVDYNEKVMAAIAQESNGRHYFVENDAALSKVFEQEAEGLGATVASNVQATIELGPDVELDRVYDRSFQRVGSSVVVPLGTFSRGDTKSILMKVRLPARADSTLPVANVELTYRDLLSGNEGKCSGKLAVELVDSASEASELDALVAGRVQRSETASVLQSANSLFAQGRIDEARRKLEEQAVNVRKVATASKPKAPSGRAKDLDRDFESQIAALDRASTGFATPPTSAPQAGASPAPAAPPPQNSRQGKGAVRKNAEVANDFGL